MSDHRNGLNEIWGNQAVIVRDSPVLKMSDDVLVV